jgi:hypothetical protein
MTATAAPPRIETELSELLNKHPDLCFQGWRTSSMTETQYTASRDELRQALPALDLCLRVFSDPEFRGGHSGVKHAGLIKHRVEFWELDLPPFHRRAISNPKHNGVYVSRGAAAAAALLNGWVLERRCDDHADIHITIPPPRLSDHDNTGLKDFCKILDLWTTHCLARRQIDKWVGNSTDLKCEFQICEILSDRALSLVRSSARIRRMLSRLSYAGRSRVSVAKATSRGPQKFKIACRDSAPEAGGMGNTK